MLSSPSQKRTSEFQGILFLIMTMPAPRCGSQLSSFFTILVHQEASGVVGMVIATHILLLQLFEQLSFYSKMASALHTHFYFTYKAQMSQVLNLSNKPFQLTLISTRSENIYVYVCDIQRYSTGNIVLSTELFFAHSTRKKNFYIWIKA